MKSVLGLRLAVPVLLGCALAAPACGGDSGGGGNGPNGGSQGLGGEGGDSTGSGGKSNSGGKTGTGNTGNAGEGGEDATAGAGGAPEPPVAVPLRPRTGTAIVAGGTVATSQNFKVILTLGEGPGGNTTMKSAKHTVNLGVIGSTAGSTE